MDNQSAQLLIQELRAANLKLSQQLQDIHSLLSNYFDHKKTASNNHPYPYESLEDLIDEFDVRAILNISRATMFRLKTKGELHNVKIGNKSYFYKSQVEGLRNKFLK